MTNPGTAFESAVADFLQASGLPAFRPGQSGFRDAGDVQVEPFVLQCKDKARLTDALREALDGAHAQAEVTGLLPAGVVRRRGRGAGSAYVVMTLADLAHLARLLRDPNLPLTSPKG